MGPEAVTYRETLIQNTKDAAKEVLYCEERLRPSLAQLSMNEVAPSTASNASNGLNCGANISLNVTVGNQTQSVTTPGRISDGYYRAINCSSVNAAYGGAIWFHCVNGSVTADTRGCLALTDKVNCNKAKENLEKAYAKTYVKLARDIDEYEQLCSSTDEQEAL